MAIDTAEKQVSFLHFHSTSRNIPLPNGAYDQSDWQTLLGRYGGISWTESALWTVQTPDTTSWNDQTADTTIWTDQTPDSSVWTDQ